MSILTRTIRTAAKRGYQCRTLQSAAEAAGEASYARALFFGVNNSHQLFPFPKPSEEEVETISAMADPVQKFFETDVDSKALDETKTIPEETLQGIKDMGLFGLQIDEELNGECGMHACMHAVSESV